MRSWSQQMEISKTAAFLLAKLKPGAQALLALTFVSSFLAASAAAAKVTPAIAATPSASSITTAQALTVKVVVTGASGDPVPAGSVKLVSGAYTSAVVT